MSAGLEPEGTKMGVKNEPKVENILEKKTLKSMRKSDAEKGARALVRRTRSGPPGPICSRMPGGPWAQYIRSGPVGARGVLGK